MTDFKVVNRFWSKVNVKEGCWVWCGSVDHNGYGRFSYEKKNRKAHRVSWYLTYGETAEQVLHSCDNPSCVNPNHLWLGTHTDNMRDRAIKERGYNTKLTIEDVREIRSCRKSEAKNVAERHDIHVATVYAILRGAQRVHVK